jgi:hypothetical protein
MVDNFTNISSTNNHLSHQIIEHDKNTTNDVENPGPGLERAQNVVLLILTLFIMQCLSFVLRYDSFSIIRKQYI